MAEATDMVSYMTLRFLRDEVEEIIEQNAEIGGEKGDEEKDACATRDDYIDHVGCLSDAVEAEESVLSIGDEYLPDFARAVRDSDSEPTPQYWAWLISQTAPVR